MRVQAVIPAAGMGERLGASRPKALVEINGVPLLRHTLLRLASLLTPLPCIVSYPEGFRNEFEHACCDLNVVLICGGRERQESVWLALNVLDPQVEIVLLHDAARPFPDPASIQCAVEETKKWGAATLAIPVSDTILSVSEDGFLKDTPDRRELRACQTPQIFLKETITAAHRAAHEEGRQFTDDASMVRFYGGQVKIVPGTVGNFKITTPADLAYATYLVQEGKE
ncbi:MAG TPA: 2-C-methyl-D-erythritol 4-phosphate cytidylyltransferase [Candidatus Hydrogenedentes bacterium]|nr:MAG: 2-C-methyl-D-erythritol 4-phosphate cytidylyltransferase [Candidatus Hydrogenedentes bacterium ADurb.Bin170]HNZ47223.1 2-C-methyl-D-erythritol 4-phosphate cytidylyltransferase [Candidatus Hydrogenedentota bacterium]HOD94517.1 2-C-methyl-D-erythritol 4-phosphate cytidylyltransferase [Candidatus Hydrogenedentota bacterium]HOM47828.1 2-C-methyl-D-erythritol 4-phosphate cytidylyltransferase [Candidatus Hydrogenedentota bacterium]HOR49893.1 2-C-methyl-D-erythritol 4-phosphate cytidylyltransf